MLNKKGFRDSIAKTLSFQMSLPCPFGARNDMLMAHEFDIEAIGIHNVPEVAPKNDIHFHTA